MEKQPVFHYTDSLDPRACVSVCVCAPEISRGQSLMPNSGLVSARIRPTCVTAQQLRQDPTFPTRPRGKQQISLEEKQLLVN